MQNIKPHWTSQPTQIYSLVANPPDRHQSKHPQQKEFYSILDKGWRFYQEIFGLVHDYVHLKNVLVGGK